MTVDRHIGIDIGGTTTRLAALEPGAPWTHGSVVAEASTDPDYDGELRWITEAVRASGTRPLAVGVSLSGRVDSAGDAVRVSLNLRGYEGRHLRTDLETALGCPVRLAHDATCGLLGEAVEGSLRGVDRCGFVTVSTGIGAAVRLGVGDRGVVLTTEMGHQRLWGVDEPCTCGQTGCLQVLTGGRALEHRLNRRLADLHEDAFWRDYARALAHGLGNFGLVAGVEVVAVGGAIMLNRPALFDLVAEELDRSFSYAPVRVVRAELGADAPVRGALSLHGVTAAVLH